MKIFNKLVRDRIPEIIESKGEIPVTRVLSDEEYLQELKAKLQEEVSEYLEDQNAEELADIYEVVLALLDATGVSVGEFENIRTRKAAEKGVFRDKIYLESSMVKE